MNLLLTIKSLFRREGVVEANKQLANLKTSAQSTFPSVDEIKGASDRAEKGVKNLDTAGKSFGQTAEGMRERVARLSSAAAGLDMASRGGSGAISGLAQSLVSLGGKLGSLAASVGVIGAVGVAAYRVGTAFDRWLGISDRIARIVAGAKTLATSFGTVAAAIRAADNASLANLQRRISFLQETADAVVSTINSAAEEKASAIETAGKTTAANIRASALPESAREPSAREAELEAARQAAAERLRAADEELNTRKQAEAEIRAELEKTIRRRTETEEQLGRLRQRIAGEMQTQQFRRLGEVFGPDQGNTARASDSSIYAASSARARAEGLAAREAELARQHEELSKAVEEATKRSQTAGVRAAETAEELRRARDVLARERAVAEEKANISAIGEANVRKSEARQARESAQFEMETPERQLQYLRNRATAILNEARGANGPVDPALRDQLAAEYYRLKKQAETIQASQAKAAATTGAKSPDTISLPQRQPQIVASSTAELFDEAYARRAASLGRTPTRAKRDPQEDVAENTRKTQATLERIEKTLQPPRK